MTDATHTNHSFCAGVASARMHLDGRNKFAALQYGGTWALPLAFSRFIITFAAVKLLRIISGTGKTVLWVVMAVVLLVLGVVMTLYSPHAQEAIRQRAVAYLNAQPGVHASLDSLSLRFPLRLRVAGVAIVQEADTMVAARSLEADVALLPLLRGEARISEAEARGAYYRMGGPDSSLFLTLRADSIALRPAAVKFSPMTIDITRAAIAHAVVDMTINPDTTPTPSEPAQPLDIFAKHLELKDFTYRMSMMPTIDSLGARFADAVLSEGAISLTAQTVKVRTLSGTGLDAAYIAPDVTAPEPAAAAADTASAAPWTVTIDSIGFSRSSALYTTRGTVPLPGLDFAYIQADDMTLRVRDFYNQATTLRLPFTLQATERCGLTLDAAGTFAMDSAAMHFTGFDVTTPAGTALQASGMMGIGDLTTDPSLPLQLTTSGDLAAEDLATMFPDFSPYLKAFAPGMLVGLDAEAEGTPARLDIGQLDIALSRQATLKASGTVTDLFSPTSMGADIALDGHIFDGKQIARAFLDPASGIAIPPMTLKGRVGMAGPKYSARLTATTLSGRLALDGRMDSRPQGGYNIDVKASDFPLQAFLPTMGVGRLTATLKAAGHGYDLFSTATALNAHAAVDKAEYDGYTYTGITLDADLAAGDAQIGLKAANPALQVALDAHGNLSGKLYTWQASLDGREIDLQAMKMSEYPAVLRLQANATATLSSTGTDIDAALDIPSASLSRDVGNINLRDIRLTFLANDSSTAATLRNRDLQASLTSPMGLNRITASLTPLTESLDTMLAARRLHVQTLQQLMPRFALQATAGDDNMINDILAASRMSLDSLNLRMANDTVLSMRAVALKLNTGSMTLDTIKLGVRQFGDRLRLGGSVFNAPGNLDDYARVMFYGNIDSNTATLRLRQSNRAGATGFDLGLLANVQGDLLTAKLFPFNPTIGYMPWNVNIDNFLSYNLATRHIDANLHMDSETSSLALYTEHPEGEDHAEGDSPEAHDHDMAQGPEPQEDIILDVKNISLEQWVQVNPFAPPISGLLSAHMNVNWDAAAQSVNGRGTVSLDDFYYDRQRVANLLADIDVSTNAAGTIRAKADLSVDGRRAITLAGNLNDTVAASPFNLDLSVIHFPLATANPFLPAGMAKLKGTLNGTLDVSGDADRPRLDGSLSFDSAAVFLNMTATDYAISPVEIPVVNNLITFRNFAVTGANDHPLTLNGTVDISDMASPAMDLALKAQNMMLLNTKRAARGADIYGKAYIDLDATVKGSARFMSVDADLKILPGTNATYVLTMATNAITAPQEADMVKFVNFADSSAVARADSVADTGMLMAIDALLTIRQGVKITVDLPTGARDLVEIQPEGTLNYTQAPLSDGRLTGRINLNDGLARYTIPVISSEKSFTIDEGSFVAFNGDILNPTLNLHATDVIKANVTQTGQNSRLVNFDVMLGVTGTLEHMDIAFDLATDDDITVANELQSMSPEQRANQAMNMLLYNVYTGPGTKGNANLSANPLYSFLESQVNNWAANNIKGVDLSFGIDQYNQTTDGNTQSTMNYSYRLSKSLFNDRFKIEVGGNYSTDAAADENFSENLINDISFIYYINNAHTMLLKIFRHTGYESILEGEVTQTGVGFSYRRRIPSLVKMLPKFMRPKKKSPKSAAAAPASAAAAASEVDVKDKDK